MKFCILCLGLLAAWAAQAQRNKGDDTEATKRACSVEECFSSATSVTSRSSTRPT